MAGNLHPKWVIAVDPDIDICNPAEVEWAQSSRVKSSAEEFVVDSTATLDPYAEGNHSSSVGIDATVPFGVEFPEVSEAPPTFICCGSTVRDAMMMNYKVLLVSDGTATNIVYEYWKRLHNVRYSRLPFLEELGVHTGQCLWQRNREASARGVIERHKNARPPNRKMRHSKMHATL